MLTVLTTIDRTRLTLSPLPSGARVQSPNLKYSLSPVIRPQNKHLI